MLFPSLVAAGCAVAGGVVFAVDPETPGRYPTCPFLALTGWYCPGCGTTRAVHALLHGDAGLALQRNPLTVAALVVLAAAFALWSRRLWRGAPRTWVAPPWVLYGLLVVILAFWVLRNVPGWTWLSPA
jgi:hypothetical protein